MHRVLVRFTITNTNSNTMGKLVKILSTGCLGRCLPGMVMSLNKHPVPSDRDRVLVRFVVSPPPFFLDEIY